MKTVNTLHYRAIILIFFLAFLFSTSHYRYYFFGKSTATAIPRSKHAQASYAELNKAEDVNRINAKYYAVWKSRHAEKLNNLSAIYQQNSDPLPTISYFAMETTKFIHRNDSIDSGTYLSDGDFLLEKTSAILPKFESFDTWWLSVPAKKLLACIIPKNMSSMIRAIMCYLYNSTKFIADGRMFHTELSWKSSCVNDDGYLVYVPDSHIDVLISAIGANETDPARFFLEWRPFAVVREPISRFLSSYTDKCISHPIKTNYCNGCGQNMTCFIIREYERLITRRSTNEITYEDDHFAPQNWYCNFARHLKDYRLIRYNESNVDVVIRQLNVVLADRANVVSTYELSHIAQELKSQRTFHYTVGSPARELLERRLRGSPFLMELIVKIYYWDFILFNYTIPDILFRKNENVSI